MGIAELIATFKDIKTTRLTRAINKYLVEEETILPPGDYKIFRASELGDMCPRQHALMKIHQITQTRKISPELRIAMDLGSWFQEHLRDNVLGPMGILFGTWECKNCDFHLTKRAGKTMFPQPNDMECPECETIDWRFSEEVYLDEELGLSGHGDGYLFWQDEMFLFELKVMNNYFSKQFKATGIADRYFDQIQAYLYLAKMNKAICMWQNKDDGKRSMVIISRHTKRLEFLLNKIRQYRQFEKSGVMPERICLNDTCDKAKKCAVKEKCFEPTKP